MIRTTAFISVISGLSMISLSCAQKPAAAPVAIRTAPPQSPPETQPEDHDAAAMRAALDHLTQKALNGDEADQVEALRLLAVWRGYAASKARVIRPLMESKSPRVAKAAADAMVAMGSDAFDELIKEFDSPNWVARMLAAMAMENRTVTAWTPDRSKAMMTGLSKLLYDSSPYVVDAAAKSLCVYNSASHPVLIKAIKEGNQRVRAVVLEQMLSRPQTFTDHFATRRNPPVDVVQLEMELADVIGPALIAYARHDHPPLDERVSGALRSLPPAAVAPELSELVRIWMSDQSNLSIDKVASILGYAGTTPIPELIKTYYGKDENLRPVAVAALLQIPESRDDPKVVAIMLEALSTNNVMLRAAVFHWIGQLRDPPSTVVDRVAEILAGNSGVSDADRAPAVRLLEKYPLKSDVYVKALLNSLNRNPDASLTAIIALRAYGAQAPAVLPKLKEIVADNVEPYGTVAAETMISFGEEGRQAVLPYYLSRLTDRSRLSVNVKAIAKFGPDAASAVPLLQKWLNDNDNTLRMDVADALGEIGPAAHEAVPALVRMTDNRDADVRQSASRALVKISPDGKGLAPALVAAVYNNDAVAINLLSPTLRRAGDNRELRDRIGELATNDPNSAVRMTARRAVDLLTHDPSPGASTTEPVGG